MATKSLNATSGERAATQKELKQSVNHILRNLSSAVAIFDDQRRLTFYNDSYHRLWGLDTAFLDSQPDDSSVLYRLRELRKLPEQADFRARKAKLHEAYSAVDTSKETWFLPDGRALSVVITPNPEGGITYLFDDRHRELRAGPPFRRPGPGAARDARQPCRRCRRVRLERPRRIVQSGLRQDVAASSRISCGSIRISIPWNRGAIRSMTMRPLGASSARLSLRSRTGSTSRSSLNARTAACSTASVARCRMARRCSPSRISLIPNT